MFSLNQPVFIDRSKAGHAGQVKSTASVAANLVGDILTSTPKISSILPVLSRYYKFKLDTDTKENIRYHSG